jgi:hypothetical protein
MDDVAEAEEEEEHDPSGSSVMQMAPSKLPGITPGRMSLVCVRRASLRNGTMA